MGRTWRRTGALVVTALALAPAAGAAAEDGGPGGAAVAAAAAGTDAANPAVSFDGTNYLVVWEEHHPDGATEFQDASSILAARVSPTGKVLSRLTLAHLPAPSDPDYGMDIVRELRQPDVAWNGTDHLVVWEEMYDYLGSTSAYEVEISGQLVTKAGAKRGPVRGLGIGSLAFNPVVSTAGADWLLVYGSVDRYWDETPSEILVERHTAALAPISGSRHQVDTAYGASPALVKTATGHLAAWHEPRSGADGSGEVFARALDGQSRPLGTGPTQVTAAKGDQFGVSGAWNGTHALMAWTDARNAGNHDVYAARIDGAGTVVGTAGGTAVAKGTAAQRQVTVARNGTTADWLVGFASGGATFDVKAQRVTAAGALSGGQKAINAGAGDQTWPDATTGGAETFFAWVDTRTGSPDIRAVPVSATGTPSNTAGFPIG